VEQLADRYRLQEGSKVSTIIQSVEAFQVTWADNDPPGQRTAIVRVTTKDGLIGYGEASPMMGGEHSLGVVRDFAASLVGLDALDQAVIYDRLLHKYIKLGPEGAVTGALAALDIALWDIKGKYFDLPIYKLLGGAWRTELPLGMPAAPWTRPCRQSNSD
jgi:L-alanine-DL-glutamate epimerase-like enolase superfamily enzyme